MKKTELAEFKKEYENAVRDVDKIINNPYTAILLKYKKAEESDYLPMFCTISASSCNNLTLWDF